MRIYRNTRLCIIIGIVLMTVCLQSSLGAYLLTNYLPVSMQALAYYIDQLQYEPTATTTVEPPFSAESSYTTSSPSTTASASSATITRKPMMATTTTRTTIKTTRRPGQTTSSWWQPPSWWQNGVDRSTTTTTTTTTRPKVPTPAHRPGLFAPLQYDSQPKLEGYELFSEISDDSDFDRLPLSLIHDIRTEMHHDEFTNDVESLDNFLRLYDDNYGRAQLDFATAMDRWSMTSTAGKKRVPPTKPYVDFLLVYDLLKRDAKASNLSKYEGYSEEMLQDLYELSQASAQRQLHTLFQRMLDRRDIQRSDVVARIQGIVADLANPQSATSKALRYIPAMQIIP